MNLDFEQIKAKLMQVGGGEGWSQTKADLVEIEYRRFLYLAIAFPDELTTPLEDVDTFWHYHILDTMKYAADCGEAFGRFLHHFPYFGMRGEADEAVHLDASARMHVLYEETFGGNYADVERAIIEAGHLGTSSDRAIHVPPAQAAYCLKTDAGPAKAAYCLKTGAAPAKAAYCLRTKAAPAKAAYCLKTEAAPAKAAYCLRTEAGPAKAAYCLKTEAAPAKAAYCLRTEDAPAKAAYCLKTEAAPAKAAYCLKTEAAPAKAAYCLKTEAAPAKAAYCLRAGAEQAMAA